MNDLKSMTLEDVMLELSDSILPYAFIRRGFTSIKIDVAGESLSA